MLADAACVQQRVCTKGLGLWPVPESLLLYCRPAQVTSSAALSALAVLAHPLFLVAACVATPLAMVLFGVCLAAGSVAFKWAVAGKVAPGVHRCGGNFYAGAPAHMHPCCQKPLHCIRIAGTACKAVPASPCSIGMLEAMEEQPQERNMPGQVSEVEPMVVCPDQARQRAGPAPVGGGAHGGGRVQALRAAAERHMGHERVPARAGRRDRRLVQRAPGAVPAAAAGQPSNRGGVRTLPLLLTPGSSWALRTTSAASAKGVDEDVLVELHCSVPSGWATRGSCMYLLQM